MTIREFGDEQDVFEPRNETATKNIDNSHLHGCT